LKICEIIEILKKITVPRETKEEANFLKTKLVPRETERNK